MFSDSDVVSEVISGSFYSEESERVSESSGLAIDSNVMAIYDTRAIFVKALIDMLIDKLCLGEDSKMKLKREISKELETNFLIIQNYDNPLLNDMIQQAKNCLETQLEKCTKSVSNETEESTIQKVQDISFVDNFKQSKFKKYFQKLDKIGSGGFGKIYKVKKNSDSRTYAIKKMNISAEDSSFDISCKREAEMASLSHLNIIKYFNLWTEFVDLTGDAFSSKEDNDSVSSSEGDDSIACFDDSVLSKYKRNVCGLSNIVLYVQMELCDEDLASWLDKRNIISSGFNERESKGMVQQILKGVEYLHSMNILHRDLKPQNVLIKHDPDSKTFTIKITDFGLSRNLKLCSYDDKDADDALTIGVGTRPYKAPEQERGASYGFKADVYSIGLMTYEIFWSMKTENEKMVNFDKLKSASVTCDEFAMKNHNLSQFVKLLTMNPPDERPSASEALQHECFNDVEIFEYIDAQKRVKELEDFLKIVQDEKTHLQNKQKICTCQKLA